MNKKDYLLILVKSSYFLTEESKNIILNKVGIMSEDEISKLGRLLALEKKNSLENNQNIDGILSQLEELA